MCNHAKRSLVSRLEQINVARRRFRFRSSELLISVKREYLLEVPKSQPRTGHMREPDLLEVTGDTHGSHTITDNDRHRWTTDARASDDPGHSQGHSSAHNAQAALLTPTPLLNTYKS